MTPDDREGHSGNDAENKVILSLKDMLKVRYIDICLIDY